MAAEKKAQSGALKRILLRVNWARCAALFLLLTTCALSMSAMAVGNWVTMHETSTDGVTVQAQSYKWGPLVYCLNVCDFASQYLG